MLRLVHPAPGGQGTDPPARRKGARSSALSLTAEEARHVRAALKNMARAYGSMPVLAGILGVPVDTLYNLSKPTERPSGVLVIRLAAAAGISVEAILTGALTSAGRCPACGHRAGAGRLPAAGGAR
jgi:hypothetical protein